MLTQNRHPDLAAAAPVDDPFAELLIHFALWPALASILERIFLTNQNRVFFRTNQNPSKCLLLAFFLFRLRNLRCTRIYIHQNLISAWFFKYLILVLRANQYYEMLSATNEPNDSDQINAKTPSPPNPALQITRNRVRTFL